MLNKRTRDEDIGGLDFDTYFDVTSNTMQHSQQREQQQMMYNNQNNALQHTIEATQRRQDILRYNSQTYYPTQNTQQHPYEMANWCINQSSDANLFSGDQTLPRPDYFYSEAEQFNSARSELPQQRRHPLNMAANEEQQSFGTIKNDYRTSDQSSTFAFPAVTSTSHANDTGLMTPISDNITPQFRSSLSTSVTNSTCSINSLPTNVAPLIKSPSVIKALQIIEQCNENKDHVNCDDNDCHETRHWRKTKNVDSNVRSSTEATVPSVTSFGKPIAPGMQFKKVAHNAIERRYRKNINERILDLKNVVPALYTAHVRENKGNKSSSGNEYEDTSDEDRHQKEDTVDVVDGVEVAKKLNKATILHKATEYIHHLKHVNELAERENQILLKILAQVPGGAEVLAEFQIQKCGHKQAEHDRLLAQRKESMDHEKIEHQRMLRERAAQRAALAELVPKPERKPYPRRASKKNNTAKTSTHSGSSSPESYEKQQHQPVTMNGNDSVIFPSSNSLNGTGNKAFMMMFLCLALVSPLTLDNNKPHSHHHSNHSHVNDQRKSKIHFTLSNTFIDDRNQTFVGLLAILCIFFGSLYLFKTLKHIFFVPEKVKAQKQ